MMFQNSSADPYAYAVRLRISVCVCCGQPIHRADLCQACDQGNIRMHCCLASAGGRVPCIHLMIVALTRSKYPERYLLVPELLKYISLLSAVRSIHRVAAQHHAATEVPVAVAAPRKERGQRWPLISTDRNNAMLPPWSSLRAA